MIVLGIHDGHNCGAALVRNGKIVAAVCEERLSRKKNDSGYPRRSVDEVLRVGGIKPTELDSVEYASLFMHSPEHLQDVKPWYRVGLADQLRDALQSQSYRQKIYDTRRQERIDTVCRHLGVAPSLVGFVEHHTAHLAAAYFTDPAAQFDRPVLGLTCDGAGDGLAATVSLCRRGRIERVAATSRHASLGKIYSRMTLLMGMTPWEHEYKLMGLAPYADPRRADVAAEPLRKLLRVNTDTLAFDLGTELSTNFCYEYLRSAFGEIRFDVMAAAVQAFTEEMLAAWVQAAVRKVGISDLVCGGGVFMNVKANMLLAELPEVRSIYVMPSASDESLAIGAALFRYYERSGETDFTASALDDLYLGGSSSERDEREAIRTKTDQSTITVTTPADIDKRIAELLADGAVVARCRGRMEWGARALGNRSILSSAHDRAAVDRINRMIKARDFWMPFAPSILDSAADRYFADPKAIKPSFMTFACRGTPRALVDLCAASHPRDNTLRPQLVTRAANPGYHALISEFERRTGRGGLLNTSFNLHGEPVVYTPEDAIRVFQNSDLDYLAMDHHLLAKNH